MNWDNCLTPDGVPTLNCVPIVFQSVINMALIFAGTVAVIVIIISGIKFVTSGGNKEQLEGARKTLTYAIIGLVLILLSFTILTFISYVTGVHCITSFGFTNCQ